MSQQTWEPIKAGHAEIETETNPATVRVQLEPAPPEGWRILFGVAPFPFDLDRPEFIDGESLRFTMRRADEQRHIDAIRAGIDWANVKYEQEELPRIQDEIRAEEQADVDGARLQDEINDALNAE